MTWPPSDTPSSETHDRQQLALGKAGHAALARLRVGVVGTGGTGSVVAAQRAHLSIGELVLVDADVVEASNVSRIVNATVADVGAKKVDVAARYARGLGTRVRAVPQAILRPDDAAFLNACDIVFSASIATYRAQS